MRARKIRPHIDIMADEHSDLDKAREIANRHGPYVDQESLLLDNVARAVAEGIKIGRQHGIAVAIKALQRIIDDYRA